MLSTYELVAVVDRTSEWIQAVDLACARLDLNPDERKRIKQLALLRSTREKSQFLTVAEGVSQSIHDLRDFIAANKRDYLSRGKLSEQGKDQVEEHVSLAVRTITQHLDALKNSVVAAQQPADAGRPLINQETAAHLHGAVLVLVEQLHSVTSSFDKCRAVRYQQSLAKELLQHRKAPKQVPGPHQEDHHSDAGKSAAVTDDSTQHVQQLDTSTQQLLAELQAASKQAHEIEKTMRQVTTLNQMISTAVMQQAEMIEQLYNDAVDATHSIKQGNVQLKKTIQVNRSSRFYLLVLLVTAGLLLLFFDWFNS